METKESTETNVIKVQFLRNGNPAGKEYTYFTPEPVAVGDTVDIDAPLQEKPTQGMVTKINVPISEIAAFKDRAKTIIGKSKPETETKESA